ncbi:hypothetical protein N7475_003713 [Penicillium sp. IBT 31633x]|nr:hypothetical protein N7475_003713 [Penicillium sp. IBT 31633x]
MHGNVSPRPEPIAMENDPGSAGPVAVVRLRSEAVVRPWTLTQQGSLGGIAVDPTYVHGLIHAK